MMANKPCNLGVTSPSAFGILPRLGKGPHPLLCSGEPQQGSAVVLQSVPKTELGVVSV